MSEELEGSTPLTGEEVAAIIATSLANIVATTPTRAEVQEIARQVNDMSLIGWFHDRFSMFDSSSTEPMTRFFQNGRYRPKSAWTHEAETPGVDGGPAEVADETDYLFIPFDDSTPPYYISKESFENDGSAGATPAGTAGGMSTDAVDISEDSVDARKVGRFIQISACCGDQYFVSP